MLMQHPEHDIAVVFSVEYIGLGLLGRSYRYTESHLVKDIFQTLVQLRVAVDYETISVILDLVYPHAEGL